MSRYTTDAPPPLHRDIPPGASTATAEEKIRRLRAALREIADTATEAADRGVVGLGTVRRIARIAVEALEE